MTEKGLPVPKLPSTQKTTKIKATDHAKGKDPSQKNPPMKNPLKNPPL